MDGTRAALGSVGSGAEDTEGHVEGQQDAVEGSEPHTQPRGGEPLGPNSEASGAPSRFGRMGIPRDVGWGWDLNLDGGPGWLLGDTQGEKRFHGFGRVRAGLLRAEDPAYYALGLTYQVSSRCVATFGIQAEALSIAAGTWLQIGGLVDYKGNLGLSVAVGISLFGLEYEYRGYEETGYVSAGYITLRVPVSMIYRGLKGP